MNPTDASTIQKPITDMDLLLKARREEFLIKPGELVKGRVINKERKQLYVDLGSYGTGIVYGIEYKNASDLIKRLNPGEEIYGKVLELENENGYAELSLREADKQRGWEATKEIHDKDETIEVSITGYNRGGLVATVFGIQAFMPVSHLSPEKYPRVGADQNKILEALRSLVGQTLTVKIITTNQKLNKLIISERAAIEGNIKELLAKYAVGGIIDGIVSGVVDFGAFIRFADNPEIEGLAHLSELDHRLIDNPRSIINVGDLVKAKIIDIKDGRVSLSLKALKENPWDKVLERYSEGQTVNGVVVKFNPFGALVRLDEDFQGLIHVSEYGSVDAMKEKLDLGVSYPFLIRAIKSEEKRIVLERTDKPVSAPEAAPAPEAAQS